MISGTTTLIGHIGYPTETFKAPLIYNSYFEKAGIDAVGPMGVKAGKANYLGQSRGCELLISRPGFRPQGHFARARSPLTSVGWLGSGRCVAPNLRRRRRSCLRSAGHGPADWPVGAGLRAARRQPSHAAFRYPTSP
jgi:hypothetical protein